MENRPLNTADRYAFLRKHSIGRRFAMYILLFSSVVTLFLTVLQLSIEYNKDVNEINSHFTQIRASYSKSLASSLWVTSQKDLELQLEGIIKLPDIQYIAVLSDKDEILAFRGTKEAKHIISETYFLKHTYRGKDLTLGKLYIIATLDGIYARLQDKVLVILLTQAVKTFLVSFFILYLFYILVGRHLSSIAKYLNQEEKGRDETLQLDRAKSAYTHNDELDQTVLAINTMRENLHASYNELIKSEKNLNKAQEVSHLGGWQFNTSTKELNWSAEVYRIYELEPFSQIIDLEWFYAHLHSDDVTLLEEQLKKALNGEKSYDEKHRILTAKGNEKFVHQKAEVHLEDDVQIISGTIQDITASEKLKELISLLSQVVEQTPFAILITDTDGYITYANPQVNELLGYKYDELITQKMNIFRPDRHNESFYANIWKTIKEEKKIWRGDIVNKTKDGRLIDCQSTIFPIFDDKRNIINFVTIQEDITQQNVKEKLFLMQTRQAQMGEMLSMIAHQWRQPLSIMSTLISQQYVDIALHNFTEENLQRGLGEIETQIQYLTKTITDFKDFFRPDKEKTATTSSVMFHKALNLIAHSFHNKNIEVIQTYLNDNTYQIYEHEFIQVILNLLKNAQDAFDEREIKNPQIIIMCTQENNKVVITIEDNAQGIDTKVMDTLFLPYVSTKSTKNGTGLGLHMSKTIVEKHCDGTLSVENTQNGAKFTIIIPLR